MIANIDTLVINYDVFNYDEVIDAYIHELERQKDESRKFMYNNENERAHVVFGNVNFEVMPNGARCYAYILHNDLIELKLAKGRSANHNTYPVVIKFKSTLLWNKGLNAYYYAESVLLNVFKKILDTKISRVDMALHVDFIYASTLHLDDFVGQFKKDSMHRYDRTIETLYFGSRKTQKVLCRLYNKTREVFETKNKIWFFDIWHKADLDITNVWNIEFELHRDYLREIEVNTFTDLIDNIKGIWHYLTHKWIRYVYINSATRRENCKQRKLWDKVQRGYDSFDMDGFIVRDLQRLRDANKYVPGAVGFLTSLSAIVGINDVDQAIENLKYEIEKYTANKGKTFEQLVEGKKQTYTDENHIVDMMKDEGIDDDDDDGCLPFIHETKRD